MPSSYNESTYGSGGGYDYTALATWEAATDNNLVTATDGEVLTCYDDGAPYTDNVILAGATTNTSYFRVIRPATDQQGTDTTGVRFYRSGTGSYNTFTIEEDHVGIYDLGIKLVSTSVAGNAKVKGVLCSADYAKIVGNSIKVYATYAGTGTFGSSVGIEITGDSNYVVNNRLYDCYTNSSSGAPVSGGVVCISASGTKTSYVYNNTKTGCEYGVVAGANSGCTVVVNVTNGIMQSSQHAATFQSDFYLYTGTETINETTCATSGVTFDADGYHLDPDDTVAKDQGTDLSSDSYYAFDDAIDGNDRVLSWDIGCDEALSAFVPKVIWFM